MNKRTYTIKKTSNSINLIIDLVCDQKNFGVYNFLNADILTENTFINFTYNISNNSVAFVNYSNNNLTNFRWDFGDNNSSTELDPIHVYDDITKDYIVKLSYFDNDVEFFLEKPISFKLQTPVRSTNSEQSSSTLINDYFYDVSNMVSGTTGSDLSSLRSYKDPNLFIGKIKNNKKIVNIIGNNVEYLDNYNSDKPISYIDNGIESFFSFIPENIDEQNISLQQIIKNPLEIGMVENIKVINNLTNDLQSDNISDVNLLLYSSLNLNNLKSSKIPIKNL